MVTLDEIIGQAVPVSVLQQALAANTMGHAYLFSGIEGVGKETAARAAAAVLAKLGGPLSEVHVLGGEATIKVDEIKEVCRQAALKPAGNSIWIILDAERLTADAGNVLLKTLEEPPQGTYFFLTTTQVHALLPTIVSRCQHLPFGRIGEEEIVQWLAERTGVPADDEKIRSIARLARGSLGRALAYWEGSLLDERQALLAQLIRVPRLSYPEILGLSQNWPEDRQRIASELQIILEWHRDLYVVKHGAELPLYNPGYRRELEEIGSLYANEDLLKIMDQIIETGKAIAGNGRIRFYIGYLLLLMKKGALT
ncbi:MAG: hypothetical protein QM372_06765 [Bacillota bacterium]|jgi:DNA polymerase-3 subunit delta'|nr:hypothetical protein [Bacillota bacterium]NLJ02076.1 hypothetical protein [Bacillota bacterium]